MIQIDIDATGNLDVGTRLLQLRQGLQSEKVHLDESCRLDDVTVVLRTVGLLVLEVRIVGSRYRNPVANRVTADDKATSMDTRTSDRALQHLGIFDGIAKGRVFAGLSIAQFRNGLDGIRQIHLRSLAVNIGQTVGNGLAQGVDHIQRNLLHTCHILDTILRSHCGIGNDMGTVLVTILVLHPFQDTATSVVIEVRINIRQRDTVRIQETLKQQVVLQRVNLGNA